MFSSAFGFLTCLFAIEAMTAFWWLRSPAPRDTTRVAAFNNLCYSCFNGVAFSLVWDQAYPNGDKDQRNWKQVSHMLPGWTKCWMIFIILLEIFGATSMWWYPNATVDPQDMDFGDLIRTQTGVYWADYLTMQNGTRMMALACFGIYALFREGE